MRPRQARRYIARHGARPPRRPPRRPARREPLADRLARYGRVLARRPRAPRPPAILTARDDRPLIALLSLAAIAGLVLLAVVM